MTLRVRGIGEKEIEYCSARLIVKSHAKKYHVVAFKYGEEDKFRFLSGSELTWRAGDVIKAYTHRWLAEVVIEDLKLYDGWGKEAMQQGYDGASRGLYLSLLLDHFLLQHPQQRGLYQSQQQLWTAGSLKSRLQIEALLKSIETIVDSPDPKEAFKKLSGEIESLVELRPSDKHISNRSDYKLEPSSSLSRKFYKAT